MKTEELKLLVGSNIRSLREAGRMEQQDLAAMCNFDKSTMSRIEAGSSNLTLATLNKIALALNVPVKDLFENR